MTYDCWKPTQTDNLPYIKCGNEECVKLEDPWADLKFEYARGQTRLITGIVFLCMTSLVFIPLGIRDYREIKRKQQQWDEAHEAQEGGASASTEMVPVASTEVVPVPYRR